MRSAHLAALLLVLLAGCQARERPVEPERFDAFFMWAGVKPTPALRRAKTIYLLDGEVRHGDPAHLVQLRRTPRVKHADIWLTVRTERLDWTESAYSELLEDVAQWDRSNRLIGVQVDFDAATKGLDGYAAFLSDLRRRLPKQYRLSVTGLLDWSAHADPAQLARLRGIVDEVVIQTYQSRHTIPEYERYLARLGRVPVPYKVALVERGAWREPEGLRRDPNFRGYVVFLLPR